MTNTVEAEEFRLLDSGGRLRARLGLDGDSVSLSLNGAQGSLHVRLQTDNQGNSALLIQDADGHSPKVDIRVDPLGCHVLLAGSEKQQSYLFLKNTGASGLVLTDAAGERRVQFTLSPEGAVEARVWSTAGMTATDRGSQ